MPALGMGRRNRPSRGPGRRYVSCTCQAKLRATFTATSWRRNTSCVCVPRLDGLAAGGRATGCAAVGSGATVGVVRLIGKRSSGTSKRDVE